MSENKQVLENFLKEALGKINIVSYVIQDENSEDGHEDYTVFIENATNDKRDSISMYVDEKMNVGYWNGEDMRKCDKTSFFIRLWMQHILTMVEI